MATINFYLERKKSNTYITMYLRYDGKTLIYATGEKIDVQYWNKTKQQVKKAKK